MNEILNMIQEERVLIYVLTIVIMLDVITGVIKAVIEHDLKSCKFKEGILKKVYDYILCLIGVCLDYVLKVDYACDMCIYAMIAMEMYSCIENLRNYIPVPDGIQKLLQTLDNSYENKTLDAQVEETKGSDKNDSIEG
jgi:toxin secretion/phage lysis holin